MAAEKENKVGSGGTMRDRLLKEAARLFIKHGYERTTMRNIASATGIKLGSITYYFQSKEDILYATMSAIIEAGEEKARAAMERSDDAPSRLRALIEVELDSYVNDTGAIVMKEWRSLQKGRRSQLIKHQQAYENIWSDVLAECHARGYVRSKPEIARRVLRGAFAWPESWSGGESQTPIEGLADEIMKLIMHD
jgi:TetR/AcrR family transcriptional regulator, cholesterol catabolism regulator